MSGAGIAAFGSGGVWPSVGLFLLAGLSGGSIRLRGPAHSARDAAPGPGMTCVLLGLFGLAGGIGITAFGSGGVWPGVGLFLLGALSGGSIRLRGPVHSARDAAPSGMTTHVPFGVHADRLTLRASLHRDPA